MEITIDADGALERATVRRPKLPARVVAVLVAIAVVLVIGLVAVGASPTLVAIVGVALVALAVLWPEIEAILVRSHPAPDYRWSDVMGRRRPVERRVLEHYAAVERELRRTENTRRPPPGTPEQLIAAAAAARRDVVVASRDVAHVALWTAGNPAQTAAGQAQALAAMREVRVDADAPSTRPRRRPHRARRR